MVSFFTLIAAVTSNSGKSRRFNFGFGSDWECSVLFFSHFDKLVALAAKYRVPAIFPERAAAVMGGLVAYGTDFSAAYHQLGICAGRVLKGEKPSDLPVQQVTKMQLAINMKTAKALNITFPTALLVRTEEVIE